MNYISFGGLGDSFLVYLKLRHKLQQGEYVDWLHIESNNIVPMLAKQWVEDFGIWCRDWEDRLKFSCEEDVNYERRFREGKWSDRIPLNTSISGEYPFPAKDEGVLEPFDNWGYTVHPEHFDVAIQMKAGAKGNRQWKFDPQGLINILRAQGLIVGVVHSNYDITGQIQTILDSKVFIGLSGFNTYMSLANRKKNIHFEESEEHNHHYIHPSWNEYRYGIKYGSMKEVLDGLKHWRVL